MPAAAPVADRKCAVGEFDSKRLARCGHLGEAIAFRPCRLSSHPQARGRRPNHAFWRHAEPNTQFLRGVPCNQSPLPIQDHDRQRGPHMDPLVEQHRGATVRDEREFRTVLLGQFLRPANARAVRLGDGERRGDARRLPSIDSSDGEYAAARSAREPPARWRKRHAVVGSRRCRTHLHERQRRTDHDAASIPARHGHFARSVAQRRRVLAPASPTSARPTSATDPGSGTCVRYGLR